MSFREMELKMGYYESQAAEATSALARKHNQAEEAPRRADDAEAKADAEVFAAVDEDDVALKVGMLPVPRRHRLQRRTLDHG